MRHIDLAASGARTTPAKAAVLAGERSLTYAELDERIDRLGRALHAHGLVVGDRVGLLAGNVLEYPEIQGACIRWGYVLVALNNRLTASELQYMMRDAQVSLLIVGAAERELASSTKDLLDGPLDLWYLGDGAEPAYDDVLAAGAAPADQRPPEDPHLAVSLMYTSGTTGTPKGAILDRSALSARMLNSVAELALAPSDTWLQVLPMFHIASTSPYSCLARGGTAVLLDGFTPQAVVESLARWQCTVTALVPTMIGMLLQHIGSHPLRLPKLRLLGYGAAPIDTGLLGRMVTAFDCEFQQWYGQTEFGGVTVLHAADHDVADSDVLSSVGRPMVGCEVAVHDDDGTPLAPGEVGEVACRGPGMMSGYWNRPDATAATIRDGWLYTGDLGRFDERGFLHLVDRRHNTIITGGENVYPREVESVLLEVPDVCDVAVFGVPDDRWGQRVAASYVGKVPAGDLVAHARRRIAKYKIPRIWLNTGAIPRNATGKVLRGPLLDTMTTALAEGTAICLEP
jgi:long-chain acyl-CoA synthetase